MPLLKRKAFDKTSASGFLKDDDEVFHCEITDEIFKDYEEYCERIILVNSMVWSCEMTGKPNLTYAEALESEKNARRSLRDFPMEIRTPILYLASRTKRCSYAEMLDDVFNFVRDRYFVGETVEACLEGDTWSEAHILSVTAPKLQPNDGGNPVNKSSSIYCYEVEQFNDADVSALGQVGTVPYDRVRRRKGVFTRDKNKLFLKQFVEQGPGGVIRIKESAIAKYNIQKVKFDQIFTGNKPEFPSSKKFIKNGISPLKSPKPNTSMNKSNQKKMPVADTKGKQTSMSKFVTKQDKFEGIKPAKYTEFNKLHKLDPKSGKVQKPKNGQVDLTKPAPALLDEMKRAGEQIKQKKLEEKQKKREKVQKLAAYVKEWNRQKDDLELEDHKPLPIATPVEIEGIPNKHIGDLLSILEFLHLYADTVKVKDVFGREGVDVDLLRRSLSSKDSAGAFGDLVQMLLTCIFTLQEDEAEEYNQSGAIHETEGITNGDSGISMSKAIDLATNAAKWPQIYLATPLSRLPLDSYTVTEILRLHLLSSGSAAGERCARWRYQQRGGYSSLDDAGLKLRLAHPSILRSLATRHVADLPIGDKIKLVQCLMNQILSYATVRDIIEDKLEDLRLKKYEFRNLQAAERKRELETFTQKQKLQKDAITKKMESKLTGEAAATVDDELAKAIDILSREAETKKAEFDKKSKELQATCFDHLTYFGSDRAYRRYWIYQSLPGLFVEHSEEGVGPCRDAPVLPVPALCGAPPEDTLSYVHKLFETEQGGASDKENDSNSNSLNNSPKKNVALVNGQMKAANHIKNENYTDSLQELLMCTADEETCLVHGRKHEKPRWSVLRSAEELDALIAALNKRGIREADLKQTLEHDKELIVAYIEKCPITKLNPTFEQPAPSTTITRTSKKFAHSVISIPDDCTLSEALELSLRDYILELEEKVFHGCLGALKVHDREAWRGTILLRSYDKQADILTWGPKKQFRDDMPLLNGKVDKSETDEAEMPKVKIHKYHDPGSYLAESTLEDMEVVKTNGTKEESEDLASVVRGLASALLQIEQAINHKYLKKPLGYDDKDRKDREARNRPLDFDALERWEVSLMQCTSFAAVALHLLTLDGSITWSMSILNAHCRLCRRRTDAENMLLCDGCNKGHHLYCLKPKLTKVPLGDWYCDMCKPKEKASPRKRRKLFVEEEIEETENQNADESWSEDRPVAGLCVSCGSGGRLGATCAGCARLWHSECAKPRPPPSSRHKPWKCAECLVTSNGRREAEPRRCAADAMHNIHRYAQMLHAPEPSDSDSSDDNTVLVKSGRRSRASKEASPAVNGASTGSARKRPRKSMDVEDTHTAKKARTPNGVHDTSSGRKKRSSRVVEVLLHTESLSELVTDVFKHRDAWAFCDPVSIDEVPDYLDVVTTPMDFSTIRSKLEANEYNTDEEFMQDSALVFRNCYLYNKEDAPVAKCGARLQKFFNKRCTELDLMGLPEITLEEKPKVKSKSTKSRRSKEN